MLRKDYWEKVERDAYARYRAGRQVAYEKVYGVQEAARILALPVHFLPEPELKPLPEFHPSPAMRFFN